MSNSAMLRAALALVTRLSRLETESDMDDRGDCMSCDDAISTLSGIIRSARQVLSTSDSNVSPGHFHERWRVTEQDDQRRLQIADSRGTVIALVPGIGDDGDTALANGENQHEYAERITACVNFCAEVSTEDLERTTLVGLRDAAMDVATYWESNQLAYYVANLEGYATDLGAVTHDEDEDEQDDA